MIASLVAAATIRRIFVWAVAASASRFTAAKQVTKYLIVIMTAVSDANRPSLLPTLLDQGCPVDSDILRPKNS